MDPIFGQKGVDMLPDQQVNFQGVDTTDRDARLKYSRLNSVGQKRNYCRKSFGREQRQGER